MRRATIPGGQRQRQLFTAALQLSDVDTTDSFSMMEGRAAPYGEWGNRGWYLETWAAGLFDKSIKEAARNLPLLIFHDDLTWPIGSASKWDSRSDGLWGTWRLDTSTEAQRAAQLAKDGHLTGLSVGYQPELSTWEYSDVDEWDPDDIGSLDRVTRQVARLVETSVVATPLMVSAGLTLVASAESTHRPRRSARESRPKLAAWKKATANLIAESPRAAVPSDARRGRAG